MNNNLRELLHDEAEHAPADAPVIHLGAAAAAPPADPCTWPACGCVASCEAPNLLRRRIEATTSE